MTPGARLAAAIDLLNAIEGGRSPADRAAAAFFRARRYIGGKDRREILDHVYAVLRHRAKLDWHGAHSPEAANLPDPARARLIAKLALVDQWSADRIAGSCDGGPYRPPPLDRAERALAKSLAGASLIDPHQPDAVRLEYPAWLERHLRESLGDHLEAEMRAAGEMASTDLRVNRLKATRGEAQAALGHCGIAAEPTPLSPIGLRLSARVALSELPPFRDGLIEVQDEGSQLVALMVEAEPGQRIVDFCAGAGGKTLALAAEMKNRGKIVACDTLVGRVERAGLRLRRAGIHNVERRGLSSERDPWVKRHAGGFDRVLVDAPCSGTGTWRRNPDSRWRLTPADLGELTALQARILESAARLVKLGGRLIYATCSLLISENAAQIARFLAAHTDFTLMPIGDIWSRIIDAPCPATSATLSLTPAIHGTDGFFVAVMERRKPEVDDEGSKAD